MLSHKDWLVLLDGIKGWGAWSVAPLWTTALLTRAMRSSPAILPIAWLSAIAAFGFFGLILALVVHELLRPEVTTFPESQITVWGAGMTHGICAYLIVQEQIRRRRRNAVRPGGFDVII
jgi:hypothetical protein